MIVAVLLAAAVQSTVRPEPYRPPPATIVAEPVALFFAAADADGDGRTSAAEVRDRLARIVAGDARWREGVGYITYSDWALTHLGDRNAVPTPFDVDRNGDNRVSADELADRMDAIFARFDADRDGVLTRAELLTIRSSPVGRPDPDGRGVRPPR